MPSFSSEEMKELEDMPLGFRGVSAYVDLDLFESNALKKVIEIIN